MEHFYIQYSLKSEKKEKKIKDNFESQFCLKEQKNCNSSYYYYFLNLHILIDLSRTFKLLYAPD